MKLKKNDTSQSTRDLFVENKLNWTKKIGIGNVLDFNLEQGLNFIDQTYSLRSLSQELNQKNKTNKNFIHFRGAFLGKTKIGNYKTEFGYVNSLESLLSESNQFVNNNLHFNFSEIYKRSSYAIGLNKLKITPSFKFYLRSQRLKFLNEYLKIDRSNFFVEPKLIISYKINNENSLKFNINIENKFNTIDRNYKENIVLSPFIKRNNKPSLDFIRKKNVNFSYLLNSTKKRYSIAPQVNYTKQEGVFLEETIVNNNFVELTNFYTDKKINNLELVLKQTKYVDLLSSMFIHKINYSFFEDYIKLNDSNLERIKGFRVQNKLIWQTAFRGRLNFINEFQYNYIGISNNGESSNKELQNNFSCKLKIREDFSFKLIYESYLPSIINRSKFINFLGVKAAYIPKKKKWRMGINLDNITNNKWVSNIRINPIEVSVRRVKSRFFSVGFNYNYSF